MSASDSNRELRQKIYHSPELLSPEELMQIKTNPALYSEWQLNQQIEKSVAGLNRSPQKPPDRLHQLVFNRIIRPSYKVWHLLLAMSLIMISPLILSYISRFYDDLFEDNLIITIFIYYGVLVLFMLLPMAFYLINKRRNTIQHLMHEFDEYLDHKLDQINTRSKK